MNVLAVQIRTRHLELGSIRWPRAPLGEEWHGVRNYQARNNMRAMQVGDRGFFYHSNIGKEIVGIVEVCREVAARQHHGRSALGLRLRSARCGRCCNRSRWKPARCSPGWRQMVLINNSRLSVQPVSAGRMADHLRVGRRCTLNFFPDDGGDRR